jgi:hypothetical protein
MPVHDHQEPLPVNHVAHDPAAARQLGQVGLNVGQHDIVVEGPDGTLDDPSVVLGAAVVVALGPQSDPRQPGSEGQSSDVVGGEEVRLDLADSWHVALLTG